MTQSKITGVKFKLNICWVQFDIAGLELTDNVFELPAYWIQHRLQQSGQPKINIYTGLYIEFDPEVVKGTDLEFLFANTSEYTIPSNGMNHNHFEPFAQHWVDLLKSDENPFTWKLNTTVVGQYAFVENDLDLAFLALNF